MRCVIKTCMRLGTFLKGEEVKGACDASVLELRVMPQYRNHRVIPWYRNYLVMPRYMNFLVMPRYRTYLVMPRCMTYLVIPRYMNYHVMHRYRKYRGQALDAIAAKVERPQPVRHQVDVAQPWEGCVIENLWCVFHAGAADVQRAQPLTLVFGNAGSEEGSCLRLIDFCITH